MPPSIAAQYVVNWGRNEPALPPPSYALLVFCTKGIGSCAVADRSLRLRSGSLLIVPDGAACRLTLDEQTPWSGDWYHVDGSMTAEYLHALNLETEPSVLELGHDTRVTELLSELREIVQDGHQANHLLHASSILQHLFTVLIRRNREPRRETREASQRIAASIEFMKRNLARSLDVPQLSEQAKLSTSHYSALFKRQTGRSPAEYFTRLRMQSAAELLEETTLSIKEIARQLGYRDPLYFSRVFAGVHGIAPSEYRLRRRRCFEARPPEAVSIFESPLDGSPSN
ncbi:MAG TPA: AraC family transcriptional regulator [Polyangiaceae bacterium]